MKATPQNPTPSPGNAPSSPDSAALRIARRNAALAAQPSGVPFDPANFRDIVAQVCGPEYSHSSLRGLPGHPPTKSTTSSAENNPKTLKPSG